MINYLHIDSLLEWMIDNLPSNALADLIEQVEIAGDRATAMVNIAPLANPGIDELVFDKVFYYLRDHLGVQTSEQPVGDGSGVREWWAFRSEDNGEPYERRETEAQAIAALLRREFRDGLSAK